MERQPSNQLRRRPRQLDERQRALLMDLAGMVEHELAAIQLAILDELTGITNRRGFIMLGQKCLQLSHRQGREASLLFPRPRPFQGD